MIMRLIRSLPLLFFLAVSGCGLNNILIGQRMIDEYHLAKEQVLLRQEIDFSQKQEIDFTLHSDYPRSAHGVKLNLRWQQELTKDELQKELAALEGHLTVRNPQGETVCQENLRDKIPCDPSRNLVCVYIPLHARFPAHLSLQKPAPRLGKAVLEVRYALCGCELLKPRLAYLIGWATLVFGLLATLAVIWWMKLTARH
ncbi:MAG: hypothetical protein RL095_3275 [Verrucomicrobiota bacterium]|jgi:hypothetical protein